MTKRCIVGYDRSAPGRAALEWALARSGSVTVVHVIDGDGLSVGPADGLAGQEPRGAAVRGRELLEQVRLEVAARHPDSHVDFVVLEGSGEGSDHGSGLGSVAWSLTNFAQPDDLLVIGTHKTGFLHGRALGSRSVEVAVLACCDVMVVPMIDLRFRSGVVTGVAEEPEMSRVVETAARVAADSGQELLLLHSVAHDDAARVRSLLAEATEIARACAPTVIIRTRFSSRPVAELLLDGSHGRALLVIGSGSANRSRSPIGSVLHDVLLNMTAPTRVVCQCAR